MMAVSVIEGKYQKNILIHEFVPEVINISIKLAR